mgnify:CR=1 FL=1
MSLQMHITFGENSTSTIRDYSTNGNHSTVVAGTPTIETGDVGNRMTFDGSTDYVRFGDIDALDGAKIYTWFGRSVFNSSASKEVLFEKNGSWSVYKNASDEIVAEVINSVGTHTVSFAIPYFGAIVSWAFRFDGTNLILFVNDAVVDTDNGGGDQAITQTQSELAMGATYTGAASNFFNGTIEEFRIYTTATTLLQTRALVDSPKGFRVNFASGLTPGFEVGDLIYDNDTTRGALKAIVTHKQNDVEYIINPLEGSVAPSDGMTPKRVGHNWDDSRQDCAVIGSDTQSPHIKYYKGVTTFTEFTGTPQMVADSNGLRRLTITKSTDYTLEKHEFRVVVDTSGGSVITITLPASPDDDEEHVITRSGSKKVTIDGNGNNILGLSSQDLLRDGDSLHLYYDGVLDNEWKPM